MKKIIFLGLLLFGLPTLQAQEFFRLGAKAGVNFANVSGDDIEQKLMMKMEKTLANLFQVLNMV